MENKKIDREDIGSTKIFDNRGLETDYRTLIPILKKGMKVLDVGCGTGAISKDIAIKIGEDGKVVGIDNTESFISSGKKTYQSISNLELIHADLFDFNTDKKFDLIVSARVLQWLKNPKEAIIKMKSMLKTGGIISILDYNHTNLEWNPEPPNSMKIFYSSFLKWRKDAGMNNQIAEDLNQILSETGFRSVEVLNSDEHYERDRLDFKSKVGIWSKVASSKQMVEEGYLEDNLRLLAIEEYDQWVDNTAISMTMKLNEVRGLN
jgi:ubiquinone/menaquinone biosynthesis C-methylase UbiE